MPVFTVKILDGPIILSILVPCVTDLQEVLQGGFIIY